MTSTKQGDGLSYRAAVRWVIGCCFCEGMGSRSGPGEETQQDGCGAGDGRVRPPLSLVGAAAGLETPAPQLWHRTYGYLVVNPPVVAPTTRWYGAGAAPSSPASPHPDGLQTGRPVSLPTPRRPDFPAAAGRTAAISWAATKPERFTGLTISLPASGPDGK